MAIDMSVHSCCGMPGDTGNSLGVGKYCTMLADCASNSMATLCTTIASTTTFFCTFPCNMPVDGGTDPCGTGASCLCQTGGCGCVPTSCQVNLTNPACQ